MDLDNTEIERKVKVVMARNFKRREADSQKHLSLFEKLIETDMPNLATKELNLRASRKKPPSPQRSDVTKDPIKSSRRITPVTVPVPKESAIISFAPVSLGQEIPLRREKTSRYTCQCGKGYIYRTGLARHRRQEHGKEPLLLCKTCSKTFKPGEKHDLKRHVACCKARQEIKKLS